MRLIDADALPNELFKKHVHDCEELEPMMYFEDAVKVVENAPTIDAIPVEWIQAQRTEHPQTVVEFARNVAYRTVLYGWRAEQEDE